MGGLVRGGVQFRQIDFDGRNVAHTHTPLDGDGACEGCRQDNGPSGDTIPRDRGEVTKVAKI